MDPLPGTEQGDASGRPGRVKSRAAGRWAGSQPGANRESPIELPLGADGHHTQPQSHSAVSAPAISPEARRPILVSIHPIIFENMVSLRLQTVELRFEPACLACRIRDSYRVTFRVLLR